MVHAQKPDLVYQRNGRVHLNRWGSQFSRLLAVQECGSARRPWIDHVPRHSARVVATPSNRLFPLRFPSHASPCAITFRTATTTQTSSLHTYGAENCVIGGGEDVFLCKFLVDWPCLYFSVLFLRWIK